MGLTNPATEPKESGSRGPRQKIYEEGRWGGQGWQVPETGRLEQYTESTVRGKRAGIRGAPGRALRKRGISQVHQRWVWGCGDSESGESAGPCRATLSGNEI